jgi:hypothetical protein
MLAVSIILFCFNLPAAQNKDSLRKDSTPENLSARENIPFPKQISTIEWPPLTASATSILAELTPELHTEVDRMPIPVLLPEDVVPDMKITLSSTADSVTVSVSGSRNSFVLYGSRIFYSVPGFAPTTTSQASAKTIRGISVVASGDEGVWTTTWEEFGVAYMLRMGCEASDNDCEDRILGRVKSLVFVGGQQ